MPAAVSLELRLRALSSRPDLRVKTFGAVRFGDDLYPISAAFWGEDALPAVVVVAGVHGDEPEGVAAALGLLENLPTLHRYRLIVLPCLNPSGLAIGTRANRAGQDINRQFHADTTPETASVRHFCDPKHVRLLVDLHTDARANGLYAIELPQSNVSTLGPRLRDALLRRGCPLEPTPNFAGLPGIDGLISPKPAQIAAFGRQAHGLSLVEWGWQAGVKNSFTLETVAGEAGASLHRLALDALFEVLENERLENERLENERLENERKVKEA